jgi:hypothetical protein
MRKEVKCVGVALCVAGLLLISGCGKATESSGPPSESIKIVEDQTSTNNSVTANSTISGTFIGLPDEIRGVVVNGVRSEQTILEPILVGPGGKFSLPNISSGSWDLGFQFYRNGRRYLAFKMGVMADSETTTNIGNIEFREAAYVTVTINCDVEFKEWYVVTKANEVDGSEKIYSGIVGLNMQEISGSITGNRKIKIGLTVPSQEALTVKLKTVGRGVNNQSILMNPLVIDLPALQPGQRFVAEEKTLTRQ